MKQITLHDGAIIINFEQGGGQIESGLPRETCPFCGQADCVYCCDGSKGGPDVDQEDESEVHGRILYNGVLDGLEATLVAAACAGLITENESPVWNQIIQSVLDGAGNNT